MDNEENTPIITSLAVANEPPNPRRPKPTPPWETPFLELLGLLKIIDQSSPTPEVDGQRFCFQPSRDLSEISRIFLSVSTSSLQYDIDLKTVRLLGSDDVPPAVTRLQEYANNVLRSIQHFRDRLLERAAIKDPTCFLLVDLLTCPLCLDNLVSCVDCDSKVACSKAACLGSIVIECEHCFEHNRMACHACLAKNDAVPPIICCPACQSWCCREDAEWCAGLIKHPALGTEELAELSRECEWDSESIERSHPPKHGPCRFCVVYGFAPVWGACYNAMDDMGPDRCPSQTPFMTRLRLLAGCCPDCLDQSPGYRCACGTVWLCETCFAIGNKSIEYPYLITCPRCGVNYCTLPEPDMSCGDYVELCRGCKGVILCNNCQEEEELPGDVQTVKERPKQVVFTTRCNCCEAWTCADCRASERTAVCYLCNRWFCHGCVSDSENDIINRCPCCEGYVCRHCKMDHRGCPGSVLPQMMVPRYLVNP